VESGNKNGEKPCRKIVTMGPLTSRGLQWAWKSKKKKGPANRAITSKIGTSKKKKKRIEERYLKNE